MPAPGLVPQRDLRAMREWTDVLGSDSKWVSSFFIVRCSGLDVTISRSRDYSDPDVFHSVLPLARLRYAPGAEPTAPWSLYLPDGDGRRRRYRPTGESGTARRVLAMLGSEIASERPVSKKGR